MNLDAREVKEGAIRHELFGLSVDAVTLDGLVESLVAHAATAGAEPLSVFSCNADMVVRAERDPSFRALLRQGSIVTADGMPIVWLGRLLGAALPERVAGADLVPTVCDAAAVNGLRVFFFGAAPGVAEEAARRLSLRAPGLIIAGCLAPARGFETRPEELEAALATLRESRAEIVFVALGAPRQEQFILAHGAKTSARVLLAVGGALDMAAGRVRRSPRVLQRLGGEWLWRLVLEPRRLARRYLVEDARFLQISARELLRRMAR